MMLNMEPSTSRFMTTVLKDIVTSFIGRKGGTVPNHTGTGTNLKKLFSLEVFALRNLIQIRTKIDLLFNL